MMGQHLQRCIPILGERARSISAQRSPLHLGPHVAQACQLKHVVGVGQAGCPRGQPHQVSGTADWSMLGGARRSCCLRLT